MSTLFYIMFFANMYCYIKPKSFSSEFQIQSKQHLIFFLLKFVNKFQKLAYTILVIDVYLFQLMLHCYFYCLFLAITP